MTPDPPVHDDRAGSVDPSGPDLLEVLHGFFLSRALFRAGMVPTHRGWPTPREPDGSDRVPLQDLVGTCAAFTIRWAGAVEARPGGAARHVLATSPGLPGAALALGISPDTWIRNAAIGWTADRPAPGPPWGPSTALGLPGPFLSPGLAVQVLAGMTLPIRPPPEGSGAGAEAGAVRPKRVGVVVAPREALTSGAVHEGFNLAAVRRSGLVLVLVRGGGDIPSGSGPELEDVAEAYGVRALRCSALRAPLLLDTLGQLLRTALNGEGAVLVEVEASPDEHGMEDPVTALRDEVIRSRGADAATVAEVEEDARAAVEMAMARRPRLASRQPRPSTTDVLHGAIG